MKRKTLTTATATAAILAAGLTGKTAQAEDVTTPVTAPATESVTTTSHVVTQAEATQARDEAKAQVDAQTAVVEGLKTERDTLQIDATVAQADLTKAEDAKANATPEHIAEATADLEENQADLAKIEGKIAEETTAKANAETAVTAAEAGVAAAQKEAGKATAEVYIAQDAVTTAEEALDPAAKAKAETTLASAKTELTKAQTAEAQAKATLDRVTETNKAVASEIVAKQAELTTATTKAQQAQRAVDEKAQVLSQKGASVATKTANVKAAEDALKGESKAVVRVDPEFKAAMLKYYQGDRSEDTLNALIGYGVRSAETSNAGLVESDKNRVFNIFNLTPEQRLELEYYAVDIVNQYLEQMGENPELRVSVSDQAQHKADSQNTKYIARDVDALNGGHIHAGGEFSENADLRPMSYLRKIYKLKNESDLSVYHIKHMIFVGITGGLFTDSHSHWEHHRNFVTNNHMALAFARISNKGKADNLQTIAIFSHTGNMIPNPNNTEAKQATLKAAQSALTSALAEQHAAQTELNTANTVLTQANADKTAAEQALKVAQAKSLDTTVALNNYKLAQAAVTKAQERVKAIIVISL